MYKYLFFDLDGTLVDSRKDLYNAVQVGLLKFGLPEIEEKRVYGFVGNGVTRLVERVLEHHDRSDLRDDFLKVFLDYYREHIADNTRVYDGMEDVLRFLRDRSVIMFVVTNKSEYLAKRLLMLLNIHHYFAEIVGGDTFEAKKPSPVQIEKLMEWYSIPVSEAIFIGDSENDILAARAAGVKIGWVSYGFRGREILNEHNVDYVFNSPREILGLFK